MKVGILYNLRFIYLLMRLAKLLLKLAEVRMQVEGSKHLNEIFNQSPGNIEMIKLEHIACIALN